MKRAKSKSGAAACGRSLHPVVLHPCPFCGSVFPLLEIVPFKDQRGEELSMVHCAGCLCDGPMGLSKDSAATVWNMRFQVMQNKMLTVSGERKKGQTA